MDFRLMVDGARSAAENMAVDEAILRHVKDAPRPTLRFYQWKPFAISIGYFQSLEKEVDVARCREMGVDVVRRITGGGAVFHDAELTYSFACSEASGLVSKNINKSYEQICGAVVLALKESFGLDAVFHPINDILVGGKKVSGNAQTRRFKGVLQHGTLLLDVDVDKMFSLLKVPDEKLRGKMISDVKQRVTSLKAETGKPIAFEDVARAVAKGFEQVFDFDVCCPETLTPEEVALTQKLAVEKFSSPEWNGLR